MDCFKSFFKLRDFCKFCLKNEYPLPFIFSTQTRIKFHLNCNRNCQHIQQKENNRYFTISFVRTISESLSNVAKSVNLKHLRFRIRLKITLQPARMHWRQQHDVIQNYLQ